jgi:hypothetical protein
MLRESKNRTNKEDTKLYWYLLLFCIRVIESFYIDDVESIACSSPAFYLYESHIHESLISRKLNRFTQKGQITLYKLRQILDVFCNPTLFYDKYMNILSHCKRFICYIYLIREEVI